MIDGGRGYLGIPAVGNGGFQDDRCRFNLPQNLWIMERFKLALSYYTLTINYLAIENQKRTPQYFIVFFVELLKN